MAVVILRIGKAISQAPRSIGRTNERLYSCLHPPVRLSQTLTEFSFDGFRVKDFFVYRTVRSLIVPIFVVTCVLLGGAPLAHAGKKSSVVVGFVGTPPPGFQNVLLNVQAVRINPNANAGPGSGKWQFIPTPPGIGGKDQSAELQIDLNTSQNVPQLFNTAPVRVGTYHTAEILLDSNNPGTLIQNCPLSSPIGNKNTDGCINQPITLNNGAVITVSSDAPNGLVSTSNGRLSPLLLQVNMTVNQAPTSPGGAYVVTVTLGVPPLNLMGTVSGSVTVKPGSGTGGGGIGKVRKLAVTAEDIGTGIAVSTATVSNGQYNLSLPAAGGMLASPFGFGTLYDLAVSGGTNTYDAERLVPLYPGQTLPPINFTVTGNQMLGSITGNLTDNCVAGKPIVGATLQVLVPPDSNSAANCLLNPSQCVTVALANTDNAGNFPLPGTITIPSQFQNVPVAPKTNLNNAYAMEISAPGYNTMVVQVKPGTGTGKKGGGTCAPIGSTTFAICNLAMNTGYITDTIPIIPPPPGQTTLVQVFAEDHGTNNIESALSMPIVVRNSMSGPLTFTLNVPTNDLVPQGFDLFASTIDLYQGSSDPYPGHTIAVKSDVLGPGPALTPHACNTATPAPFDQAIDCVGHGSITGTVAVANLGTSVILSKQDTLSGHSVQLTNSMVENQAPASGPSPANSYSFCAPADTYEVQTAQIAVPEPSMVPMGTPTPVLNDDAVSVTIPPPVKVNGPTPTPSGSPSPTATSSGPTPTSTPTVAPKCPTTCSNPDGSCPGICNNVFQPL